MSFKLTSKKLNKKSATPLKDLCMLKIAKNFSILENEVACLPYVLINDLLDNRNKYKLDEKSKSSKVFINSATTNLVPVCFMKSIKSPVCNLITYPIVDQICETCKNVTTLHLRSMSKSHKHKLIDITIQIRLIKNFPKLQSLVLAKNSTDEIFSVITTHCPKLRYLDSVRSKNITDIGINFLCSNNNIKISQLDISGTHVTVNGCLSVLNTFKQLKNLTIEPWEQVFKQLKLKLKSTTSIEPYNVQYINHYTLLEENFQVIINFFPKVRSFQLFQRLNFNLPNALTFCSQVKEIQWYSYSHQPDVRLMGHVFPTLKYLDLNCDTSSFQGLTDVLNLPNVHNSKSYVPFRYLNTLKIRHLNRKEDLWMVLANCYCLEKLCIIHCDLTDDMFTDLIKSNPLNYLKELEIANCKLISTNSLLMLIYVNNCLEKVKINYCPLVDYGLLQGRLKEKNFNVKIDTV